MDRPAPSSGSLRRQHQRSLPRRRRHGMVRRGQLSLRGGKRALQRGFRGAALRRRDPRKWLQGQNPRGIGCRAHLSGWHPDDATDRFPGSLSRAGSAKPSIRLHSDLRVAKCSMPPHARCDLLPIDGGPRYIESHQFPAAAAHIRTPAALPTTSLRPASAFRVPISALTGRHPGAPPCGSPAAVTSAIHGFGLPSP